jgi:hypothetical protein
MALALLAALALAGCASSSPAGDRLRDRTLEDLRAAAQLADDVRELLPASDPWGPCAAALAEILTALEGPLFDPRPGDGLYTATLRAHVLDHVVMSPPPAVRQHCGAVAWAALVRGAKRLPGL